MPIITGRLAPTGAMIDLLVGVSNRRAQLLRKHKMKVPDYVRLRVLIDTGATVSGFSPSTFEYLELQPVTRTGVLTPANTPGQLHQADFFDVGNYLVAGGRENQFGDFRVMAADCWLKGEGIEGLIGWDILNRCFLQCHGLERTFTLSF
jgi:hypothetical protein